MATAIKKTVKTVRANKTESNVVKMNVAPSLEAALLKMEEFGRMENSATARYDAAVYYGVQVNLKIATDKDAPTFVERYLKGLKRKLSAGSMKTVVSQFRGFASEEAHKRRDEIKSAILATFDSAPVGRSIDLFAAAYRVNSKINSAAKSGKPATAAQVKTLVKAVCMTTEEKQEHAKAKRAAAIKKDPAAVAAADLEQATKALGTIIDVLVDLKLTKAQKEALGMAKIAFKL